MTARHIAKALFAIGLTGLAACSERSPNQAVNAPSTPITPTPPPGPSGSPPVTAADSFSIEMNSPQNRFAVLANDTDPDNDPLSVTVPMSSAQGGRMRVDGTQVLYWPPLNYTGADSFLYNALDGNGNATTETVNITITGHAQAPNAARPCERDMLARRAAGRPYCFDIQIANDFDNHVVSATVYVPADQGASLPPMILHAHGFGESRFASLENPNTFMINRVTAQSMLELWHEGYWVISYDQRGFNANGMWGPTADSSNEFCSPGTIDVCINGMSPEFEARDQQVVVDWLVANLRQGFDVTFDANSGNTAFVPPASTGTPALFAEDSPDDPVLGTIGLSYGGGFQTMGSANETALGNSLSVDTRIDAMVPVTTWWDFGYSLVPNNVFKSAWVAFLTGASVTGLSAPTAGFLSDVGGEVATDMLTQGSVDQLEARSPRSYSEGMGDDTIGDGNAMVGSGQLPGALNATDADDGPDVFIIQGQRDVLFNLNQAFDMATGYKTNNPGADVRLLMQTEGHIHPTAQLPAYVGPEVIYIDETVTCGNATLQTREMISGWMREKLGVIDATASPLDASAVPVVCVTHFADPAPLTGSAQPVTGTTFNQISDLQGLEGGTLITFDTDPNTPAIDPITFSLSGIPASAPFPPPMSPPSSPLQPVQRYDLHTASSTEVMLGVPLLNISVTAESAVGLATLKDVRFFVDIAVRRAGTAAPNVDFVIADQVTPISGPPVPAGVPPTSVTFAFPRTDSFGVMHGDNTGRISGGAVQLEAGDTLVLQFYAQHSMFFAHSTVALVPPDISITGTISLPLLP